MSKQLLENFSSIVAEAHSLQQKGKRIVLVSGNFNVIHPGHLRFLNFAANSGDCLIVAVTRNNAPAVYVPEELRLGGIRHLSVVNFSFLLPSSLEDCLRILKPDVVVKGKEFEFFKNTEKNFWIFMVVN